MTISARKHIAIIGDVNAGKSMLLNMLLGQDAAVVSNVRGTTTDPVIKAAELLPYGPVVFIDTAGLNDNTRLGQARINKTHEVLKRCVMALNVTDIAKVNNDTPIKFETNYDNLPVLNIFTKCDLVKKTDLSKLKEKFADSVFVSASDKESIETLRKKIIEFLQKIESQEQSMLSIKHLLPENATVMLVAPIDTEAPKGRLILPQSQIIRECLDCGFRVFISRETELENALKSLAVKPNLVITDSKVFEHVNRIIPKDILLTSFSMYLAWQKGDFSQLVKGASKISSLKNNNKILMLEGCTHNHNHEDIGRVIIPALFKKKTGLDLKFDFYSGYDFPKNCSDYALAIQCGSCMLTRKSVQNRLALFSQINLPVTNYGIVLAHLNGILERTSEVFFNANKKSK